MRGWIRFSYSNAYWRMLRANDVRQQSCKDERLGTVTA